MTLEELFREGRLKKHQSSKKEIQHLLSIVVRDLNDAQVLSLSLDRRFATAYSAALQAGRVLLAASGYRTSGGGHHMTTFGALKYFLAKDHQITLDYFNACRDKRNLVDYGVSGIISEKEVREIIMEATKFSEFTRHWLKNNYPHLI